MTHELEDSERRTPQEQFESLVTRIRTADELDQVAVGLAINIASTAFHQTHGSVAAFQELSALEKIAYIKKWTAAERMAHDANAGLASLGFYLFKLWVMTVAAGDDELRRKFEPELSYFSRIGDFRPNVTEESGGSETITRNPEAQG